MINQERDQPNYFQSKNLKFKLWYRHFGYASNTRIIQALKLMDEIDLDKEEPINANEEQNPNARLENNKNVDSDIDKTVPIHKVMDINNEIELCNICVESKHIKIVKSKRMTSTTRRLQEIHTDLWRLHNPPSLSRRNYIALFLNKYT